MGASCGCGDNDSDLAYMDMQAMHRQITDQKETDAKELMNRLTYWEKGELLAWYKVSPNRINFNHSIEIKEPNRIRVKGSGRTWSTMICDSVLKCDEEIISWKYTVNKFVGEMVIGWINYDNTICETMQTIWNRGHHLGEKEVLRQYGISIVDNGKAGLFFLNNGGTKEK